MKALSPMALTVFALMAAPGLEAQQARLLVSLDQLERKAAQDSNDAPAHYELALGYWLSKRYDDADKQLVRPSPSSRTPPPPIWRSPNVRALYVLGVVASQLGSTDEARDAFTQFIARAPSRFSSQKAEAQQRLQTLK